MRKRLLSQFLNFIPIFKTVSKLNLVKVNSLEFRKFTRLLTLRLVPVKIFFEPYNQKSFRQKFFTAYFKISSGNFLISPLNILQKGKTLIF